MKQLEMWSQRALVGAAFVLGAGCDKGSQEAAPMPPVADGAPVMIAVPGAPQAPAAPVGEISPSDAVATAKVASRTVGGEVPSVVPPEAAAPSDKPPIATADPTFSIALTNPGPAAPGATVTAKVTALPGKGFKINKEFPATLQLEPHAGVVFSPARIERTAALVDHDHELTFGVQMSASEAGDYAIKGLLKFAVCDDANCMPKKQAVALDLHVK